MRISDWSSDVCSSDLVRLCATGGAFPFEYTSGSFPDKDVAKIADRNKWIFGGQLGVDWAVNDALQVKLGAAYYDFTNVQGQLSEPCALYNGNTQCSSDGTRLAFLSKGNSLFQIGRASCRERVCQSV